MDQMNEKLIVQILVVLFLMSLLRCPLSGWLWSASTTGSSPIRVTCGATVSVFRVGVNVPRAPATSNPV